MRISDWSSDVCSSDLAERRLGRVQRTRRRGGFHIGIRVGVPRRSATLHERTPARERLTDALVGGAQRRALGVDGRIRLVGAHRSEEHTSELPSLMRISYAVFCLTTKTPSQVQTVQIVL